MVLTHDIPDSRPKLSPIFSSHYPVISGTVCLRSLNIAHERTVHLNHLKVLQTP